MNAFLKALHGLDHDYIPVWFMRQAGRYLNVYKDYRKKLGLEGMMTDADVIVKITHSPVDMIGVDAAIIFADITTPLPGLGFKVRFEDNVGPIVLNNLSDNGFSGINEFDEASFNHPVLKAISMYREMYREPLIGFCGSPVTLLSYLIAGSFDKDLAKTKRLMLTDPSKYKEISTLLTDASVKYAKLQIKKGVDAFQLFDSWAGYLSPRQYKEFAVPYINDILSEIAGKVPTIYFSTMTSSFVFQSGIISDFISVDWRVEMDKVVKESGDYGLQGNLDPFIVNYDYAFAESEHIINAVKGNNRYIFNTGHGILPDTDPKRLIEIVKYVHSVNL
ncbi:uroporphyrinogen decarboxylase [Thermoplasma volcanium GSS1]|uniref:Uroporphyrinogen decarboxylase n=1 Tax=Thermoplasma volcanium (strain ATCC 51530 / DSM 4299 / JCM 9571 / NBRC 15438 / GSS1) TaxID=273116 RepID=Q978V0_THEVO|nr:uroporphyrinogen decarboxylase [Thermoplasma volcanium]BAB60457.1 uroporphyrinogen decarboxylase [Thermoplasma volcanium GSS1]